MRIGIIVLLVLTGAVGVLAVEPISVGTVLSVASTVIGTIGSLLSFLITALRFIAAWTLLIIILFVVGIQFIPILQKLDLVAILEGLLAEAALCSPAGPKEDNPEKRGNLAYRDN